MRYEKEATIRLSGDRIEATKYISQGRKLMGELLRDRELGGTEQRSRVIRLHGDVVISALTFTGLHQIEIFAPPNTGEIEETRHGFRIRKGTYPSEAYNYAIYWDEKDQDWAAITPDLPSLSYDDGYTTHWSTFQNKPVCLAFAGKRYDAPRAQTEIYIDGFVACSLPVANAEIYGLTKYNDALVALCHYTSFPYTLFVAYRKFKKTNRANDDAADSEYRWKISTALSPVQFGAPYNPSGEYTTNQLIQTVNFSETGSSGTGLYTVNTGNSYTQSYYRYYVRCSLSGSAASISATISFAPTDSAAFATTASGSYDKEPTPPNQDSGVVCYCGWYDPPDYVPCTSGTGSTTETETAASSTASTSTAKYVFAVDYRGNVEVEGFIGNTTSADVCSYSYSKNTSYTSSCAWPYGDCYHSYVYTYSSTVSTSTSKTRSYVENAVTNFGGREIITKNYNINSYSNSSSSIDYFWIQHRAGTYLCGWYVIDLCDNMSNPLDYVELAGRNCNVPTNASSSEGSGSSGTQIDRFIVGFDLRYDILLIGEVVTTPGIGNTVYYVIERDGLEIERWAAAINWYMCANEFYHSWVPTYPVSGDPCSTTDWSYNDTTTLTPGTIDSPCKTFTYPVILNTNFPRNDLAVEKDLYGDNELELLSIFALLRSESQNLYACPTKSWTRNINRLTNYPPTENPICDADLFGTCESMQYVKSLLPYKLTRKLLQP